MVQAARGGEVEPRRDTAHLEQHRRQGRKACGLFRDPQRVLSLAGAGKEKVGGLQGKAMQQARRIGLPGLVQCLAGGDPEDWTGLFVSLAAKGGKRQCKARHRSGIAALAAMDFRQCRARQPAAQNLVEPGSTRWQILAASIRARLVRRHVQPCGQGAFDACDFLAQSKKSLTRHGGLRHDAVTFNDFVPVMFL